MFDDCTGAEIKVVNAPCCRSLITLDHPDLEETEVTRLIRRDKLPLIRQLSHDTPINLLKRTLGTLNALLKQFITYPFTKSCKPGIKYSGNSGSFSSFCPLSRQVECKRMMLLVISILLNWGRKSDTLQCFRNEALLGKFLSK